MLGCNFFGLGPEYHGPTLALTTRVWVHIVPAWVMSWFPWRAGGSMCLD